MPVESAAVELVLLAVKDAPGGAPVIVERQATARDRLDRRPFRRVGLLHLQTGDAVPVYLLSERPVSEAVAGEVMNRARAMCYGVAARA